MSETTQQNVKENQENTEKTTKKAVEKPVNEKKADKKKKGGFSFFKFILALLILFIVVIVSVPTLRQKVVDFYQAQKTAVLEKTKPADENETLPVTEEEKEAVSQDIPADKLTNTDETIAEIENNVDPIVSQETVEVETEVSVDETQDLKKQIDALNQRLKQLEIQNNLLEREKADNAFVAQLQKRLQEAEKQLKTATGDNIQVSAMLMALAQLQRAVNEGRGFLTEEQALVRFIRPKTILAEKVKPLKAYAERGVVTAEMLKESFSEYARRLIIQEGTSEQDSWLKKSLTSLRSLIVVRRLDASVDDMSTSAILARAEIAVENGQFQAAVLALKNLNNKDIAVMMPWISDAERMLLVHRAVDEITAILLAGNFSK